MGFQSNQHKTHPSSIDFKQSEGPPQAPDSSMQQMITVPWLWRGWRREELITLPVHRSEMGKIVIVNFADF